MIEKKKDLFFTLNEGVLILFFWVRIFTEHE